MRTTTGAGIALAALLLAPLARADSTVGFPPLENPHSSGEIPGKFVFAELVTPDLAGAERFYGGLFGWTFRDIPIRRLRYAEASVDGHNVAGLIERPLPPGSTHRPDWLPFVSTPSVDTAVTIASNNGGRVLYAPRDIPGFGQEAVLADPQGAVFAVLSSASGDPADSDTAAGDWIWSSLLTPDPDAAATFYGKLFPYQAFPAPDSDGVHHLIVAAEYFSRASINSLPAGLPPNARARWLRFVRVADVNEAATRAVALGGRILAQPHVDREGSSVAILADPAGAAFGVMAVPDDAPAEGAK